MIPASRRPVERSLGLNLIASSATKIGTDAFAIAATPESMCFSPQAISVNGIAPLIRPEDQPLAPGAGDLAERGGRRAATQGTRAGAGAAISIRSAINAVGSKSRTPTLMKRYEAPQIAARAPINTGYERVIT